MHPWVAGNIDGQHGLKSPYGLPFSNGPSTTVAAVNVELSQSRRSTGTLPFSSLLSLRYKYTCLKSRIFRYILRRQQMLGDVCTLMVSKLAVLDFSFRRCETLHLRSIRSEFHALIRFWCVLFEDETARVVIYMRIHSRHSLRRFC